jgi:hypothetical protein
VEKEFKIWKTIELGTRGLRTAADARKVLEDGGCKIDGWAKHILDQLAFTVAPQETEVDLVVVHVFDLGFQGCVRTKSGLNCACSIRINLKASGFSSGWNQLSTRMGTSMCLRSGMVTRDAGSVATAATLTASGLAAAASCSLVKGVNYENYA